MQISFTGARWIVEEPEPSVVHGLVAGAGIPPALARCLALREVTEPAQALRFLDPGEADLHDPFAMDDMQVAVARLERAVAGSERIRIVTDYDVDGTTSSLILQAAVQAMGARDTIDWHIPDRFTEGYGFSEAVAERAVADGVGLLVAADVGVRDHASVRRAVRGGVDVIVCDHHIPDGEDVPAEATAVLCPNRPGSCYPTPALAACGISFKLAQALLRSHPKRALLLRSLLKLAAIGTVADVVDLSWTENRAIVAMGLAALSEGPNSPGLAALLQVAGCQGRPVSSGDVGFRLGPRINAAGRVEHARAAMSLLLERDPARAKALARELDELNTLRQQYQERLVQRIVGDLGSDLPLFPVFAGPEEEGWHRGVVGIVAGKVKDRVHRPVAVASIVDGVAAGSIRSVPGVHAVQALDSVADLLLRYGGHPVAAGFALPAERLPELVRRLSAFVASACTLEDLVPERTAELHLEPTSLTLDLHRALQRLAPFGQGNPQPRVVVRGARPTGFRVVRDKHLFVAGLDPGQGTPGAVWWGGAEHREALEASRVDLLGHLDEDNWNGACRVRLVVEDARRA